MATFTPIITTSSPVTITTGLPTLTYAELQQSINGGGFQVKVNTIYIKASSFSQLSNNWYLNKTTQNGFASVQPDSFQIDPSQFQPTAFLNLEKYEFVLDILCNIGMQMEAYSSVNLVFFADYRTNLDPFAKENEQQQGQQLDNTFEDKNISAVKTLPKQNNEVAKKALVAVASVGIIYLIISKL